MRILLLTLALTTVGIASAQDRTSLDRFAAGYDKAELTGDSGWFLAHLDEKGTVGSGKSVMTRAMMVKQVKASKAKPMAMFSSSKTHIDKAVIVGKTATVDYTTVGKLVSTKATMKFKGHAVMVWKKGDWRIMNVDSKPIP